MKRHLTFGVQLLICILILSTTKSNAQVIAGGFHHSLAICNTSGIMSWGRDWEGQLGDSNNNVGSNIPVSINSISGVTAVAGGYYHTLLLKNNGTVWTCGYNYDGQLGIGTNTDANVPTEVTTLANV